MTRLPMDDLARDLERYNAERNEAVKAGMTLEEFDALHGDPVAHDPWRHVEMETDPLGDTITHELDETGEHVVLEVLEGE